VALESEVRTVYLAFMKAAVAMSDATTVANEDNLHIGAFLMAYLVDAERNAHLELADLEVLVSPVGRKGEH
jgi:hypothetical protein